MNPWWMYFLGVIAGYSVAHIVDAIREYPYDL